VGRSAARVSGLACGLALAVRPAGLPLGSRVNGAPQARPRAARMRSTVESWRGQPGQCAAFRPRDGDIPRGDHRTRRAADGLAVVLAGAAAQRDVTELGRLRRRVIQELVGQGMSYGQIAEAAGLSRGRIHQIRHKGPAPRGLSGHWPDSYHYPAETRRDKGTPRYRGRGCCGITTARRTSALVRLRCSAGEYLARWRS
jgi:hypothetical protein